MSIMASDVRYALRRLAKSPGFTFTAVLTLALGIGVNTMMFTVLNGILLRKSLVADSGRVVSIFRTSTQTQNWPHSPANIRELQARASAFENLAAYSWSKVNLATPGQPAEQLTGMTVSWDFFPVFRTAPALGRVFTKDEDRSGGPRVAVLSDGFWRSHYGADPGIVGRTVRMDGQAVTIIGVMPEHFDNPLDWGHVDLWTPLAYNEGTWGVRNSAWLQAIGRLKAGASLEQAQAQASVIAAQLARDHPDTDAQTGMHLDLWNNARVDPVSRHITWLCMGLSGFVLLIACANLANLQLARAADRIHENALRIALGASRIDLIRQVLVESLVLSLLGGAIGVVVASWGTRVIGSEIFIGDIAGLDLPVDATVLVFSLVMAVATGIIFGTAPAWLASRMDVNASLKQNGRSATGGRSRNRVRQALIVSELVLALVLLCGAGYFVRGMQRISHNDMGWKPEGLVTAALSLPYNATYSNDEQCRAFFDRMSAELAQMPGVKSAVLSGSLPISGFWQIGEVAVEGQPALAHGKAPLAYTEPVSPGYFSTLAIPLVRGRDFTAADRAGTRHVAIINEAMAAKLWPGEDPIGKRVGETEPDKHDWRVVVGVVGNVHSALEIVRPPETPFQEYRPLAQAGAPHYLAIAVRSSAPLSTQGEALRRAVTKIDPDEPVSLLYTAPQAISHIMSSFTLVAQILSAFAGVGLLLSAVGLYGVIANLVAQRTSEIGIRMALGAQVRDVMWMIMRQGMTLVTVGSAAGLACAYGLVRLLNAVLPSVPGGDPVAVACTTAALILVALVACWLPARRATTIDPIIALRSD